LGPLLIAINHGHAIIAGQIMRERIFQMFLTGIVPCVVSIASSVATRHELSQVSPVGGANLRMHRRYRERELVAAGQ